tara:strand:- start:696 stop:1796 length:1101 start_codon:yes stop_codon:yes gene_type:complete
VLFLFGFFSKQTPIGYFFLIITPIIILNLRKISQLRSIFLGSLLSIFLFFIYIFLTQTNIIDIYHQYILTASEVGSYRFNNSSFSFYDIFYRYRFIYISLFFLLYLIFRYKNFEKYFKISKFQLIYLLVALNCTLIFHQLLSMNQAFILSLIFLNFGMCFRFISFDKSKLLNNKIFFLIIIISILVCTRYHFKYNEPRRFNDLAYSNKTQKINAGKYFPSLNKLHWFTRHSNDPKEEIKNLKLVYNILEKEKKIYSLVTDYQFLPSELKKYGNFPIKWFHPDVSFPVMPPQKNKWWNTLGSSMREQTAFKNFFVNQLRVNKVEKMYFIPPDGIRKEIIKVTIENDCRMDDLSLVKDQYEEISINCM